LVDEQCIDAAQKNYAHKYGTGLNWLENNAAFLSSAGQWYLDDAERKIYYMARPDQNMTTRATAIAIAEQLMIINGASYLEFDGITVTMTNWYGYQGTDANHRNVGYTAHQSGDNGILHQQPAAAIDVIASDHVTFRNSDFSELGGSALIIRKGSTDISVVGNRFASIAATALQIGTPNERLEKDPQKQNAHIVIENNRFNKNGTEYWDNAALMAYAMRDSSIAHNEISNCPWSCIAFGWGWGGPAAYNANVKIAYNLIHDGMQRLYDGGGIYTNGKTSGGMVIEGNVIDHIGNIENPLCEKGFWKNNFQLKLNL
jgi:beta-glucuronidase